MLKRFSFAISTAALVCLLSGWVSGQQAYQSGNYTVYGVGTSSCGQWVESAGGDRRAMEQWAFGFVSGFGYGGGGISYTDTAALRLFIDNYCKANPFSKISAAASAAVAALEPK